MNQQVIIFYPGTESYIGLWQSSSSPTWQTKPVPKGFNNAFNPVFKTLQELLDEHQLTLSHITSTGVMQGPASYTQLRSFITAANSIAWAAHIPLFTVSPDNVLPDDLPSLITQAQVDVPAEPVYPSSIT